MRKFFDVSQEIVAFDAIFAAFVAKIAAFVVNSRCQT